MRSQAKGMTSGGSGELGAVVEVDVLPDVERPGQAVGADLIGLGDGTLVVAFFVPGEQRVIDGQSPERFIIDGIPGFVAEVYGADVDGTVRLDRGRRGRSRWGSSRSRRGGGRCARRGGGRFLG